MNVTNSTHHTNLEEEISYHNEEALYHWTMLKHHAEEAYEHQQKMRYHREEIEALLGEEVI